MEAPFESGKDRSVLEDGMQQVHLNVSGHLYTTSLATLKAVPTSRLAETFRGNWKLRRTGSGKVFIDRDGEVCRIPVAGKVTRLCLAADFASDQQAFGVILQYLRDEKDSRLFIVPCLLENKLARLKAEADFYGLCALHDMLGTGM